MCLGTKTERPIWRNLNGANSAQPAKTQNVSNSSEAPQFNTISSSDLAASKAGWLFYDDRAYNSPTSEFDYDSKTVTQTSSSPSTESEFLSDGSETWRDERSDASFYPESGMGFSGHNAQPDSYAAYQGHRMVKGPSGYGSFNFESGYNSCAGSFHSAFELPFQSSQEMPPAPMNDMSKFNFVFRPEVPMEKATAQFPVVPLQVDAPMTNSVSVSTPIISPADQTVKVERKVSPASILIDTNGSRSYRQQTSELINKLDKLLKFPAKLITTKGRASKGKSKRSPKDLMKPRPRNVVLKQAVELIWRIKCDEEALALREQDSATRDPNSDTTTTSLQDSESSHAQQGITNNEPTKGTAAKEEPLKDELVGAAAGGGGGGGGDASPLSSSSSGGANTADSDVFLNKWVASFDPAGAASLDGSLKLCQCSSSESSSSLLDMMDDDAGFQWDQGDSDPGILSLFREQLMYARDGGGALFAELGHQGPNPPPPL